MCPARHGSAALAERGGFPVSRCSAHFFAGEPDLGLPFGQESVERARPLGDDVLLAASLLLYLQAMGVAASGQLFGEAIACTERSGDHLTNSWLHNDAGWVVLAVGDIPAARAHLDAAAQIGDYTRVMRAGRWPA